MVRPELENGEISEGRSHDSGGDGGDFRRLPGATHGGKSFCGLTASNPVRHGVSSRFSSKTRHLPEVLQLVGEPGLEHGPLNSGCASSHCIPYHAGAGALLEGAVSHETSGAPWDRPPYQLSQWAQRECCWGR